MKLLRNIPITPKFILWFLIIAILPLAIATRISYDSSRSALIEEITNGLIAVAENKANQISTYLYEKERNATQLAYMSDVVNALKQFDRAIKDAGAFSPAYIDVDNEYRGFFTYYQKSSDFTNLFLANKDGDVIFSVKGESKVFSLYELALYRDSQMAEAFIKALKTEHTEISDFEYRPEDGDGFVYIAAPVFEGSDVIGVLMLEMNNKGVSKLVKDYTSLGETGEVILTAKIGDSISYISPIRFDEKAAFNRKVAIGSEKSPEIQDVIKGAEDSGIQTVDYRGHEVVSVTRFLPTFRWGMIVKMDTAEIVASADTLKNTLLKIAIGFMVIVITLAVLIANSMSKPIKQLTNTSATIAGGDYTARAEVHGGDEIGILAQSFNDMTDKLVAAMKAIEEKKEKIEEQASLLEEANKELDAFTHTVSHDLKAPLRGVASFAQFLVEDYRDKLDDEGKEYIDEIHQGTQRMNRLITDLLELSRLSRIKNPFEVVDINTIVDEVLKRIAYDIENHKVKMDVNKQMPTLVCDRIKLTEVFLNLINNAIKFSSKQDYLPEVEVGYSDEGEFAKFWVKDNGIGIAPENHDTVFGIFKRLHSQDEFEGSGAGLGIVKKVIEDHKGKIWIESDIGKGTTFLFTIPKNLEISKPEAEAGAETEVSEAAAAEVPPETPEDPKADSAENKKQA